MSVNVSAGATAQAPAFSRIEFTAGSTIYREGEPGDIVYRIESGEVEVLRKSATGELIILGMLRPPAIFGETSIILGRTRSSTARAFTDVKLIAMARDRFLTAFDKGNPFALPLLKMLCTRLSDTNRQLLKLPQDENGVALADVARLRLHPGSDFAKAQMPGGEAVVDLNNLPFSVGCRFKGEAPKTKRRIDLMLETQDLRQVSPEYFAICVREGKLWIEDIGSASGTLVNGHRLGSFVGRLSVPLRIGETLVVAGGPESPMRFLVIVEPRATE